MIPVDATYQDILNNGGQYEWQIVNGANTFTKANIISGTITSTLHEQLSVGNVISAQLDIELRNVTVDTDSMLQVQFRATDGTNNSNWIIKGEFFIDTLETSPYSEITKITAFDALLKTETDFMPTGSYVPMTALETVEMIADDIGVPLDNDTKNLLEQNPVTLTNAPNVGVGGTTDREMLSYIATIYGGNWVIKWGYYTTIISGTTYIVAGETLMLVLPYNTPTNMADVGDAVVTFDASEVETVKRIKLWLNYETYYLAPTGYTEEQWLALGGRCIEAQLPFYATQAIATNLLSHFNNISFYPYVANEVYLDPKYEVGDRVKFKTTNSVTSVIASQTITLNPLAPSNLEFRQEDKVNSLYPYISSVQRNTIYQVTQAAEAAASAEAAVGNANYKEQTIYISKASGTSSVSANTTWVTDATGNQNTWTTTRPVYSSSYPVLFVATQRQSVSQSSGTTCTCTTPVKDQTTTVIDGGHITTGTIDASQVNVTNINASNITSGTINAININGSTITGSTLESTSSGGSIKIADGSIDFYENATTTGTPFSQLSHVYNSSLNQHAIEWNTTGYTKLINQAGGQWTADFIQFALNAQDPHLMFLIYPDSDGTYARFDTDYVKVNSNTEFWANVYLKSAGQVRGFLVDLGTGLSATIQVSAETINGKTNTSRWILLNYSYNSTTGDRIGYYDAYALPYVDKNKTSSNVYNILTTKTANTLIWSGSLTTTGVQIGTDAYKNCNAFVVQGRPSGANKGKTTMTIPKALVSSSEPTGTITDYWSLADENNYVNFCIWYSGNNLYMKKRDNNGSGIIETVYGLI